MKKFFYALFMSILLAAVVHNLLLLACKSLNLTSNLGNILIADIVAFIVGWMCSEAYKLKQ